MKQLDFAKNNRDSALAPPKVAARPAGRLVLWTLLLLGFLLGAGAPAQASHFRYGILTWRTVPTDPSKLTVQFKVSQAWRLSFGAFANNVPVPGAVFNDVMNFGDGTTGNMNLVVTSVDVPGDSFYAEAVVTHTYAAAGDYRAFFTDCCRIYTLSNNANSTWYVNTLVNAGSGNNSPVSTLAPVVNLAIGQAAATFQLPASDPDGDALTYSLATSADINNEPFTNAPTLAVNPATGAASFSTVGRTVGQLFNGVIKISDGRTSILVDFLINITAASTAPVFDYSITPPNGYVYRVAPGQAVTFGVRATDSDPNDVVNLKAFGLPAAATTAPTLPLNGNPVQTAFTWTPTAANLGTVIINFVAQDLAGVQTSTSVTIEVSQKPRFDVPPTPANTSVTQVTPGTALRYTIQASSPVATNRVSIASAAGLPASASFAPALPTAAANPTSTQLSWTPTLADWGPHAATFVARDNNNEQATHALSFIINSAPAFTSQPSGLTRMVGQAFTYNITATDPDLPYGDRLSITASVLPSWLQLIYPGNGTATLSGTPTLAQVGTHRVTLTAEDIYHHGNSYGTISQTFVITVMACNVAAVPTATNPSCTGSSTGSIALAVTGALAPATYAWTGPNRFQATTPDLKQLGAGTYTVVVTGANGCTATAQATLKDPAPATPPTITVSLANPVVVQQPTTIFLGYGPQTATLTATGGVSYRWSPATNLSNASIANPVFAPTAAGQYTYTVTATNATGCQTSATVTLSVIDANCGNNAKNPKVLVCHEGHEICISPNAVPAHVGPSSKHNDYLGSCMGVSMPGTVSTAAQVVLEAYPNPVTKSTVVNFRVPVTSAATVQVYNQMGVLVATLFEGEAQAGRDYPLEVDASRWPTGIYLCRFVSKGQTSTQQLMVTK